MTVLFWPFQWLALAGFLATVVVHLMALLQMPVPPLLQPYINDALYGILGAGVFVVWIPTVLAATAVSHSHRLSRVAWSTLMKGCPVWMRNTVYGLFAYAFINFFLVLGVEHNAQGGGLVPRGFSGHWLLFYGAAFAVLYSITRRPELLKPRTCVAGHAVSPDDQFCPSCGQPLVREMQEY